MLKIVLIKSDSFTLSTRGVWWTYQHPAVEADAESQVESGEHQQSPESLQQQGHQTDLEHVGVEHHQQDDYHVEQDGNVLDAANSL